MNALRVTAQKLYRDFGPQKAMENASPSNDRPHYFLNRNFLGDNDLLIILNTRRCRYQCDFCELPAKSGYFDVPDDAIMGQVAYVLGELKHSLSLIQRVTLSNEGSLFDSLTMPREVLFDVLEGLNALRRLRRVVLETRLEFLSEDALLGCKRFMGRCRLDILTGFETRNEVIRDEILGKWQPLCEFLKGLDIIAAQGCDLTAYVLYKPDPGMTDAEAAAEAQASVDFLIAETAARKIHLTLRINPMYGATGSKWIELARATEQYCPPSLAEVLRLAKASRARGILTYVGLSTEGLESAGFDYHARKDYSAKLLLEARAMNESGVYAGTL